jgi:hypothetical protein
VAGTDTQVLVDAVVSSSHDGTPQPGRAPLAAVSFNVAAVSRGAVQGIRSCIAGIDAISSKQRGPFSTLCAPHVSMSPTQNTRRLASDSNRGLRAQGFAAGAHLAGLMLCEQLK